MGAKVRFVATFGILVALFYASLETRFVSRAVFPPIHRITARTAATGLSLLRHDVSAFDGFILCRRGSLAIGVGCDAVEPSALLIAAIVAFPATVAAKAAGALIGLGFVFLLNVLRVMTLAYAFDADANLFRTLHVSVWPAAFMVMTLGAWLIWAIWARRLLESRKCAPSDSS